MTPTETHASALATLTKLRAEWDEMTPGPWEEGCSGIDQMIPHAATGVLGVYPDSAEVLVDNSCYDDSCYGTERGFTRNEDRTGCVSQRNYSPAMLDIGIGVLKTHQEGDFYTRGNQVMEGKPRHGCPQCGHAQWPCPVAAPWIELAHEVQRGEKDGE